MASTIHPPRWLPILPDGTREGRSGADGGLAERVNEALDELAEALARQAPVSPAALSPLSVDLADGPAGAALFFHYLDQARPGQGYDDLALACLEAAIEALAEATSPPALFAGFSGVAWTLEHLTGRLLEPPAPDEADGGAAVARALAGHLRPLPRYDGYDLIGGLAGLGVWALERGPRAGGVETLEAVVRHLSERAERRSGGVAWRTPPELLSPSERAACPQGCFKIGVAHGIAGVIGLLGAAGAAGLGEASAREARELLAGAVAWLLHHLLPPGASARCPGPVGPGVAPAPDTRLAWCHGDVGVAVALLAAARAAQEPEWERQALAMARSATARPLDLGGVIDGGLCHGASGLAHLYNRLFQATGEPLFRAESLAWIERLLDQREPGQGMAGWLAWRAVGEDADRDLGPGWERLSLPGFLTGAAGIGLTLLGAVSPVEPLWDRVLLCAVPPAAALPLHAYPISWSPATSVTPGNEPGKGDRA